MDEDTTLSFLKRAFPPGLEDAVTSIETKMSRTTEPFDDLDDNKKRWLTVGISLHDVISSVLREYIFPVLIKLYYKLTISYQIDRQTHPCYLRIYSLKPLNYETINKNKDLFGKCMNRYDYRVQNPVDLSKLFLQTHMTKYKDIDESCDSSALLGIIISIDEFPALVRANAEKVRSSIRNPWAHCTFTDWDNGQFETTFSKMESLINSLKLKTSKKNTVLDELTKWKTNGKCSTRDLICFIPRNERGPRFFKGTVLGLGLVEELTKNTSLLAKNVKVIKFLLESYMENKAATEKVIQDELRTLKEKIKDITQRQEEIIPKHIRVEHENEIRDWEKDDEMFVETRATEHVMAWLSKCNIAVLTGSSGTGKSFLIHHIALELHRHKKYDIIPLSFENASSTITDFYSRSRKQVFVIDDICGKGTIHSHLVKIWEDLAVKLKDRFISNSIATVKNMQKKLLISCRLRVFNDSQFQRLTLFTENAFDLLSKPLCLLPEERILMLKKYVKSDNIDQVIDHIFDFDFFPLLCKMSQKCPHENLSLFFTSPIEAIKDQIKHITDTENQSQLCALILCSLLEGGFEEEWLKSKLKTVPNILRSKLIEIAQYCEIDLKKEIGRRSLKYGFSTLEGTFLRKVGTKYSVMHDKIHDVASIVCGRYLEECFIKYAHECFIGDKYTFASIENNPTDEFIALPEEMEEEYFERLVKDLKERNVYSTLHNRQLVHKSFRQKLIKYMNNNAKIVQEIFDQIDKHGIEYNIGEVRFFWNRLENTCFNVEREVKIVTFPLIAAAVEGYVDIVELLIKLNCNVNKRDNYDKTALYTACEGGYHDVVEILIKHNADASLCDAFGSSPLHVACRAGSIKTIQLLLTKDVDVRKLDRHNISPLREACQQGNVNIVRLLPLQNEADVNVSDTLIGFCPLHSACEAGHLDVVKFLLENKSEVNLISNCGDSPLGLACEGGFVDIVKELFDNNAKIGDEPPNKSPLFLACRTGRTGIVKILLAHITDFHPNIFPPISPSGDTYSPFDVACKQNHVNIIQLLLQKFNDKFSYIEKRSSLSTASLYGCIDIVKLVMENPDFRLKCPLFEPLYLACAEGHIEIVQYFLTQRIDIFECSPIGRSLLHATCETFLEDESHKSIIYLLIQNQLEISKGDENGLSPLHLACDNGLLSICKLLIENQADINMQDDENRSPLHVACLRKNSDVVEVLLENKADLTLCDNYGKTPLHVICERCKDPSYLRSGIDEYPFTFVIEMFAKCKSIVKSFIDLGANVNSCDSEGDTPLHNACRYGDYELVKIILSSKKSDVSIHNGFGQTPLHYACLLGNENVVQLLLEEKADIHKKDKEGLSPLIISCLTLLDLSRRLENLNVAKDLHSEYNSLCRIFTLMDNYMKMS